MYISLEKEQVSGGSKNAANYADNKTSFALSDSQGKSDWILSKYESFR